MATITGDNLDNELFGSAVDDTLIGLGGNDTLLAGDGDDILIGGDGNDILNGGGGNDEVLYYRDQGPMGVTVDLLTGIATDTYGNTDTLISIEYVFGSEQNDILYGSDLGGERLFGRDGDDTIDGRDGKNLIYTGSGNDLVYVGTTLADARDTIVIDGNGDKTIVGTGAEGSRYGHHIVFQVDAAVTVNLATGVATSANMSVDFSAALHFLELGGSAYDDHLTGGNVAHDYLEWYVGNQGNDIIDGGSGTGDTIVYDDEVIYGQLNYETGLFEYGTQGAVVNLATGVATDTFGFTDTLINIDQVRGTEFVDNITGSDEDNGFWGLGGSDIINGGAGFDRVHYGEDYLTGGTSGINANLTTGVVIDGFGDTDRLVSIESVHATDYNDILIGDAVANRLAGYGGDDTIAGGAGDDVLLGHEGNDNLSGGLNDDELWGHAGNDILDGGAGIDVVRYLEAPGNVTVNLVSGTAIDGYGNTDTLLNIEDVHVSENNDHVTGNAFSNRIFGNGGNDTLNGGGGNDVIMGGTGNDSLNGGDGDDEIWGEAGADTLDGGAGSDLARYRNALQSVDVNLATGTASDGYGGTDTLISIENIHGSDFNDSIRGDSVANRLFGYDGADVIIGGGGNDVIMGGTGNDSLNGGDGDDEIWGEAGADTLDGGAGYDLARYRNALQSVDVNLATGTASDGYGGTDTLISIENIHGSDFNDSIRGDSVANRLFGYDGADVINGGGGNDVIMGGTGNDSLNGGDGDDEIWGEAGADTLDGGAGSDLARYRNALQSVDVNLATGTASDGYGSTDTLISIENIHGSDFNDSIRGDSAANRLFGFDGNDIIVGGAGDDTLVGGNGGDTYLFSGGHGYDIINDLGQSAGGADRVIIYGYLSENARIYSQSSSIVIDFGVSSDVIVLANSLDAGHASAIETVQFGDGLVWDHATLVAHLGQEAIAASLTPTNNADAISGTDGNDTIDALGGNDLLNGLGGNDILLGGSGNDTVRGGDGDDIITGGAGNDALFGDAGADRFVLANGMGHDHIYGFELGADQLDTTGLTVAERAAITLTADANGDQLITLQDGSTVVLSGVVPGSTVTGQVTLTGTLREDETLVAEVVGTADIFGDPAGPATYQWFRDGVAINGATGSTYLLVQADVDARITARAQFTDNQGTGVTVTSAVSDLVANTPDPVSGQLVINGTARTGDTLTLDTSNISDEDGLGSFSYQWLRDGTPINGATLASYTLGANDAGTLISAVLQYTDGYGALETVTSATTLPVEIGVGPIVGTAGDDVLNGGAGDDIMYGYDGNDRLFGNDGNDELYGGDGTDTLVGGLGDDTLIGGATGADRRDVIYGGDGNDTIDGGYGNDELRGDAGDDRIAGGFGADRVIGGTGNDVLTGSALGDEIFGGDGFDFINGGFGYDRVNGGAGGDKFYHLGIADHGSDWIQDYVAADGDVLLWGGGAATAADFLVQVAETANAGVAGVQEIFVTHIPTLNLLWALVDGDAQGQINIQIGGQVFDLLPA